MQFAFKVLLIIWLLIPLNLYGEDSLRIEDRNGRFFVIHQVEKGETVYSLSRRYGVEMDSITIPNSVVGNQLSLGQVLAIPVMVQVGESLHKNARHTVKTGETLFAISRLYGLTVDELREKNGLPDNNISVGQELIIVDDNILKSPEELSVPEPKKVAEREEEFIEHVVQTGEKIENYMQRYGVTRDSILIWNNLASDDFYIGQILKIKKLPDSLKTYSISEVKSTSFGSKHTVIDADGFRKVFEEGVAARIEDVLETKKYLALHRTLPVGTLIEVRNLMNNQKVFVKVVSKLPETGLNENVLIRLTPAAFKRLGIIDARARVEISYFLE